MSNTRELLKLAAANPDLPIVPLVDYEVVCEDCGRWIGSIGSVSVGEYALFNDRYHDEREDFKEHYFDYYYDELCERFNYDPLDEAENKELEKHLDEVAERYFTKAILVNIDLPDMEDE